MQKILFVPDIHNKLYIFKDIDELDSKYKFDKIIFFGDYTDDWNTTFDKTEKTLKKLTEYRDRAIYLVGNHDAAYIWNIPCAGKQINELPIRQYLTDNIDLKMAVDIQLGGENYTCSHGGITEDWINQIDPNLPPVAYLLENWVQYQNVFWRAGYTSGGTDIASPLWCRPREMVNAEDRQIVAHTPVSSIFINKNLICIDTHSTDSLGREIGDKSYLLYDQEFQVVKRGENGFVRI